MKRCVKRLSLILFLFTLSSLLISQTVSAQEVDKGKIPKDQLAPTFKTLAWGSPVWDVEEAVLAIKSKDPILWVDTRPASFFESGTVRGAILLPYDKKGKPENKLTEDSLKKALADQNLSPDNTKIVMFCQGPLCHRSYNATFAAVSEWGYKPENMIWFRAGYPLLLKEIKSNAKLKRRAKNYISDAGVKDL